MQICTECGKPYNSDDLLYCPVCAKKFSNLPETEFPEPTEDEFFDILEKEQNIPYPEPKNYICGSCRGVGCIQCQPGKYL